MISPKYIIRFDDICPTMNWEIWDKIEKLIIDNNIKPLIAVVPNNMDRKLIIDQPNRNFWDKVRYWQDLGWDIAMHGYNHSLYENRNDILRINTKSEFSGLEYNDQLDKIDAALSIFKKQCINIRIWVAPAHSFDDITLKVLELRNIRIISDGLSVLPFSDAYDNFWIPQQLWKFRKLPFGVWTVCFHHNNWNERDLNCFKSNVISYKRYITDVTFLQKNYNNRNYSLIDSAFKILYNVCFKIKKLFCI